VSRSLTTTLLIGLGMLVAGAAVTVWFGAVDAPAPLYVAVMSVIATGGGALLGVFGLRD
jgi:hypothetical protein